MAPANGAPRTGASAGKSGPDGGLRGERVFEHEVMARGRAHSGRVPCLDDLHAIEVR